MKEVAIDEFAVTSAMPFRPHGAPPQTTRRHDSLGKSAPEDPVFRIQIKPPKEERKKL